MWMIRKALCIICLSVLSLFLFAPSRGTCAPTQVYTISETELQTLENNLTTLELHNETLKAILTTQDSELTEALNLLMKSQDELTKLRDELQIARNETQSAQNSLQIANEELQKAAQSFKEYEKERDKVENRLRTQRNIWEALFAVAVGVAIAR